MEERRHEALTTLDWLQRLDEKQTLLNAAHEDMRLAQAELKILQIKDLEVADEWRKTFCSKLDKLFAFMSELPCKERKAWYESTGKQLTFMWVVLAIFIAVCITSIVTAKVSESAVMEIKNEVVQIKKVSYGYQDYIEYLKSRQYTPSNQVP